ncbi:MAG: DUF952 domain-containing protein [Chloroflexota bacterium]|nr:DUF952 domain-containing protein [Chloroflexota bacterium]
MIYHITSGSAWDDAKRRGTYRAPSLENEGFIHCSTRDQLLGVANAFYRGREDLALLCIDESKLRAELRWEAPAHPTPETADRRENDAPFPHIYGVLNLDAVVAVCDFRADRTGFALPDKLP